MTNGIWKLALKTHMRERGKVHAVVVIAATEESARTLASQAVAELPVDRPYVREEYLDPAQTRCEYLGIALPEAGERLLCVDYDYDYDVALYPQEGEDA